MKGIKSISLILIVLGGLILLVGLYFNYMQWPDLFKGIYSGPVLLILGLILFIIYKVKRK